MIKQIVLFCGFLFYCFTSLAQFSKSDAVKLQAFQDSLKSLGNTFINHPEEPIRKSANYTFIKTLVSALKTPNSFLYPFDSVKSISVTQAPDNRFRIFSWHVANDDGSYRFYGAIQMNTGGALKLYPLEDNSPLIAHPEDIVTDNTHWYGAQYYTIVPVQAATPYYVLLGWKGYTDKSTKKVIETISFKNDKPVFGSPLFDGKDKRRSRVVFQYARQASMLLRYVAGDHLIVFDNLAPPDTKLKDKPETFGPDLTYNGYRLKNGRWQYQDNLDMRNVSDNRDETYIAPERPKIAAPVSKKRVQ